VVRPVVRDVTAHAGKQDVMEREILIPADGVQLPGALDMPSRARGVVVFAHGSGSSRLSPRNREVAALLRAPGRFGTLLFDLLTPDEDRDHARRFDIPLLVARLVRATEWVLDDPAAHGVPVGYFGASTGAAAALEASTLLPEGTVRAVVSRGGRPDLAGDALQRVAAPTLLIVGGSDTQVIELNETALRLLGSREKRLEIVPGATHLFEEPGTLEQAARLSYAWFDRYLVSAGA
jgi:putative phosphoribosyl transferase